VRGLFCFVVQMYLFGFETHHGYYQYVLLSLFDLPSFMTPQWVVHRVLTAFRMVGTC
jgi:hypothetical protein